MFGGVVSLEGYFEAIKNHGSISIRGVVMRKVDCNRFILKNNDIKNSSMVRRCLDVHRRKKEAAKRVRK